MKPRSIAYSFAILVTLPSLCMAAGNVFLATAPDGSIFARDVSGVVLWHSFNGSSAAAPRTATEARATPSSPTTPMWDPLTNLDPSATADPIAGPIFDSLGNAWVVIDDRVNLLAIRSNGTSGTWQAPHIIGPSLPASTETVGLAVDQAGGFYVTYGTGAAGDSSFPLLWTKYTPALGWQAPAVIYTSPSGFSETFAEIDSAGRLVVLFNANGISSIASNPSQSGWGPVQTISPATDNPILPSVAANKSGTRLALVYLLQNNVLQRGLRYTFFNSTTGNWNGARPVPNSGNAYFSGYSTLNAYPMAVDESGNITLATPLFVGFSNNGIARPTRQWSVGGFRYENGVWSMQQLTAPLGSIPDLESFGSTALNANGAVLISAPLSDGSTGTNITVFRFTPGAGWNTEIAASYSTSTVSRCKVAWFEGTEAVVVYNAAGPLLAALYANGAWGSAPPIPGSFTNVTFPALAGAPTGEALLGVPENGVYVTYLRP
jgi:hypothetical protein